MSTSRTPMSQWVLLGAALTGHRRVIAGLIAAQADTDRTTVTTLEDLAMEAGLSPRATRKRLAALAADGLIRVRYTLPEDGETDRRLALTWNPDRADELMCIRHRRDTRIRI